MSRPRRITWYREGKLIKLTDGTMQMTFDEFRAYAGVDSLFNIDAAVYKVNNEDRVEFVPYPVRDLVRSLREGGSNGNCSEESITDRNSITVCDDNNSN